MKNLKSQILNLKFLFILCGCFILHSSAFGLPPSLSLEECLERGLSRSIPIQNSTRDEFIANARIKQTRAQLLPAADIDAGYTRLDEAPVIEETTGSEDTWQATASLSQLLFSGGSASAALKAAKEYRNYANFNSLTTINRTKRDIRVSFYDVLYQQARLDVANRSLKQLEELEKQSQLMFDNETASEFDLLSAQVKVANEKPKVIAAQNALAIEKESFSNLIYLDSTNYTLNANLQSPASNDQPPIADLLQLALENRPELFADESLISMQEQDVKVTRGKYLPQLYAQAAYQGKNPAIETPVEDEWRWHWTAGVALKWSILDGGLRGGQVAQKALTLEKTRADHIDLKHRITLEVKKAYLSLTHSRDVLTGAQNSVKLAQRALAIADVRYKNGLFTYLEYTDSNLSLSEAQLTHYAAMKSYYQALANLKYACGTEKIP